jgi:dTMP kinase
MIEAINRWAMNEVMPDLILYLALDVEKAFERIAMRHKTLTVFEKETKAFWEKVITGFRYCCKHYPNMVELDASQPLEVVTQQAMQVLQRKL